uniref:Uncharacterized protein n=1 Tax=Rhizophora mucronata TaxID=61149 RepID=A0A2P2N2A4_RHIMU
MPLSERIILDIVFLLSGYIFETSIKTICFKHILAALKTDNLPSLS